jgi:hypothetical protein
VTLAEVEQAVRLYRSEVGAVDIGFIMGRSKSTILAILRANSIPIRKRGAPSMESRQECPSFRRMAEDARFGSTQLLAAIERAGVRP